MSVPSDLTSASYQTFKENIITSPLTKTQRKVNASNKFYTIDI